MGEYKISGGNKLSGEVLIRGGKNAILPILASTVLNGSKSIIHNCPKISDSFITCEILKSIGCSVIWNEDTMIIDSSNASQHCVPEWLVREMRSSIIFLGSVLGRFGKVKISHPGGCENFWRYRRAARLSIILLFFSCRYKQHHGTPQFILHFEASLP